MFAAMMMGGPADPCAGAPTPVSVTKSSDTLNACAGDGWKTVWTVSSGSLGSGQEFYWEIATNSAGTNWAFHSQGASLTIDVLDQDIGSDGPGSSQTDYRNARVYVIPVGGDDTDACTGPVTGTQANRTADACFA